MQDQQEDYIMSVEINYTLDRADSAVLSRDFVLAAKLYKNVLRSTPEDINVMSKLANCYIRGSEDRKALQVCLDILKLDCNNFDILNKLGGIYRRLCMYHESVAVLERALTLGKNSTDVYYNMGQTYKVMGEYVDAEECFNTVIEENPNDVLAYNHLGSIQALRGDHSKAVLSYSKALQIDPNHPILHFNIATSYEALGKFADAQQSYENALRSKPGWIEAMCKYSDLLLKLNKMDEAKSLLMHASKIDMENVNIQNSLGKINLHKKEFSVAEKYFNEVLKKQPTNIDALIGLSATYERVGKNKEAIELLEKLETLCNKNVDVHLLYAKVLMQLDRLRESALKIKKIRDEAPENLEALNLLGQLFILKDETARLKDCFRKIASIDPNYIQHYIDCAEAYYKMQDYNEAKKLLRGYIAKNDKDYYAFELLGKTEENLKNFVMALRSYQKALKIRPEDTNLINHVSRLHMYEDLIEEIQEPVDELNAEPLIIETLEQVDEKLLKLDDIYNIEAEPLDFELQEEEIPFDEMPKDENPPPIEQTVTSDETPIDFSTADENDLRILDPFKNYSRQQPIDETETLVKVEECDENLDFEDSFSSESKKSVVLPQKNEKSPVLEDAKLAEKLTENKSILVEETEKPEDKIVPKVNINISDVNIENSEEEFAEEEFAEEDESFDVMIEERCSEDALCIEDAEKSKMIKDFEELSGLKNILEEELAAQDIIPEINVQWLADDKNYENENLSYVSLESFVEKLKKKLFLHGVNNYFPEMCEFLDMIIYASEDLSQESKDDFVASIDSKRLAFMVYRLIGKGGLLATANAFSETGYADILLKTDSPIENYVFMGDFINQLPSSELKAELIGHLSCINSRWQELKSIK